MKNFNDNPHLVPEISNYAALVNSFNSIIKKSNNPVEISNAKTKRDKYTAELNSTITQWVDTYISYRPGQEGNRDHLLTKAKTDALNEFRGVAEQSDLSFLNLKIKNIERKMFPEKPKTLEQQIADGIKEGISKLMPKAIEEELIRRERLKELQEKEHELDMETGLSDAAKEELEVFNQKQNKLKEIRAEIEKIETNN